MKYLFVIESGPRNLSGYFPDVPGCVTTGKTVEEILVNAREALEFHLEDETEVPPAQSLEHLAGSLNLDSGDLVAIVEYEHKALAPA